VTAKDEEDKLPRSAALETEQRTRELRRRESYLAEAQRLSHTGSFGWKVSTGEIFWSAETFRIFQYEPTMTPTVERALERVHPDDLSRVKRLIEQVSRTGEDFDVQCRLLMPDGSVKHVHVVGHALGDEAGGLEFAGAVMDITAAKKTEENLRQREAELRQLIDVVPQFIFVLGPNGERLDANKVLLDYHGPGVTVDVFRDPTTLAKYFHPDDREHFLRARKLGLARGQYFELEGRQLGYDGRHRWFMFRYSPLRDDDGRIIRWYGTATDLDDHKRVEDALRRSEAYLAEAQRLSRTGSFVWSVSRGDYVYWSAELHRIFRHDPAHGLPSVESAFNRVHPEDRPRIVDTRQRAIRTQTDQEVEMRLVFPGEDLRYMLVTYRPVVDESGDVVELLGTTMDITAAKRAEEALRQARADLAHVNRVTTVGELTASLAHEVNQPIAAAVANANACLRFLARDTPDLEEACTAAEEIVKDGTRAAEIISRIHLLFKKGTPHREPVDVNDVIREMTVLLRGELMRYAILVRTELAEDLPAIMGDRVQMQQVIMNLIVNGIDAMRDVDDVRELAIASRRAENEHVALCVSDTGVGLPAKQADRIFNAFFTTKPHGTGMGLSISRSIVEAHGGRLWAADNSPRGASFHLMLPVRLDTDA